MSKSQLLRLSAQVPEIAALIEENVSLREALERINNLGHGYACGLEIKIKAITREVLKRSE